MYDQQKPFIPLLCSLRRKLESSPLLASSGRVSRQERLSGRWGRLNPCQASGCCDTSRGEFKKAPQVLINDKYDSGLPLGRAARVCSPGIYLVTGRLGCKPLLLCSARILWMNEDCTIREGGGGQTDSHTGLHFGLKKVLFLHFPIVYILR